MATVTGDLELNAFGQPDTNPVTLPANLTGYDDSLRYFDNKLRVWDNGGFYSTDAPSLDTIVSKIEIGADIGDSFGPAVINTSKNGLYVECRFDSVRLFTLLAGVGTGTGTSVSITLAPNDEVFLTFTNSTGAYALSVNGVDQFTGTDATYSDLRAGYFFAASDYANTGAFSWAADGYAAAVTITPTDATPNDGDLQTITCAGMTGDLTAATFAGLDVLSSLSSIDTEGAPIEFTVDVAALATSETSGSFPRIGQTSTISFTTATDGAVTTDITMQPKTGWAVNDLAATLVKGVNDYLTLVDAENSITTAIGNQDYYKQLYGESITPQGVYTGGSLVAYQYTEYVIQQGGSATTVALSYGEKFYPFGEAPASSTTRKLTFANLTGVKLTSNKLIASKL